MGSSLDWRRKAVLAWIAPRGIVAAAVSALFALQLEQLGFAQARVIAALTFLVIVVTVVLQSLTTKRMIQWLGMSASPPRGVLIVGGHPVARALAKALHDQDVPVLLADSSWSDIRAARMDDFPVYRGNILSEHADTHLDLTGMGLLLAMSPAEQSNILVSLYYRPLFGSDRVYALRLEKERDDNGHARMIKTHRIPRLFGETITLTRLQETLEQGGTIRAESLTANFDFAAFRAKWGEQAIPLFALDPEGQPRVFSGRESFRPDSGWTLLSLVQPTASLQKAT